MKEFKLRFITLFKFKAIFEEKLKLYNKKYIIFESKNKKWIHFFIESGYGFKFVSFIEIFTLSITLPILYFIDAPDHE